jgi:hypothetical protein
VYTSDYKTRLYSSKLDSVFEPSKRIEDLFFAKLNTGNGSFSLDGTRFYFSLCEDERYNYK